MSRSLFVILWTLGTLLGLAYLMSDWRVFTAGILAVATLAVVFTKAEYGFYIMLLILPVGLTHFSYYLKSANYTILVFPYMFAVALTAAALFVRGALEKKPPSLPKMPLTGIMAFAVVYLYATFLWAPNKQLAFALGVCLLPHVYMFFIIIHFIRDANSMRRTINVLMIAGVIASTGVILSQWESYEKAFSLGNGLNFSVFFGEKNSRPAGFAANTETAGFLSVLAFLAVGRFIASERNRDKALHGLLASYMTIGMILTACRGAFVGMVVGIIFLMIAHPFTRSKVIKYSAITFVLFLATILVAKPSYLDRIMIGFGYKGTLYFSDDMAKGASYTSTSDSGASGMDDRKYAWEKGLTAMLKRPLTLIFGLGLGGFIIHAGIPHTHSVILSFFYDMGLVGVVILMISVMILSRQFIFYMIRAKRTYTYYMFVTAVAAFLAEVCVHGLIDYDFYSYSAKNFWIPLGYVLAGLNIVRNENHELESEIT